MLEGALILLEGLSYLLELIVYCLSGWAYLFSGKFRERTNKRWRQQSQLKNSVEIIGGIIGVLVSLALLAWLISYLLPSTVRLQEGSM